MQTTVTGTLACSQQKPQKLLGGPKAITINKLYIFQSLLQTKIISKWKISILLELIPCEDCRGFPAHLTPKPSSKKLIF